LNQVRPGWQKSAKPDSDLGELLLAALGRTLPELQPSQLAALADQYDRDGLHGKETDREQERLAREKVLRQRFVDAPRLTLPLSRPSISFDPTALEPLVGEGTFYKSGQVSDEWGVLQVTDGMIKSANGSTIRVEAPTDTLARPLKGNGWELMPQPGWQIVPDDRPGDLKLQRLHPEDDRPDSH
jgi:hypothetical protein